MLAAATSDAAKQDLNSVESCTEAVLLTDNTAPVPVAVQASAYDSNIAGDVSTGARLGSSQQPTAAEQGHHCSPLNAQQQSRQEPTAAEQEHPCAPSDAQQSSQQPTAQPVSAGLSEQSPQAAASTTENQDSSAPIMQSVQGNDVHATDSHAHTGNNDPSAASGAHTGVQFISVSSSSKAVVPDSSVPEVELTPVVKQGQGNKSPAAPRHAAKSRADSQVSMSVHKPLAFTPAAGLDISRPNLEESPAQGVKSDSSQRVQADVATLIRVKFAELMASKQHTPNEAAVLAMQHVSAARRG